MRRARTLRADLPISSAKELIETVCNKPGRNADEWPLTQTPQRLQRFGDATCFRRIVISSREKEKPPDRDEHDPPRSDPDPTHDDQPTPDLDRRRVFVDVTVQLRDDPAIHLIRAKSGEAECYG